jgi:hypothetical protein
VFCEKTSTDDYDSDVAESESESLVTGVPLRDGRGTRAAFFERQSARLVRMLRDHLRDEPQALQAVTDLIGELVVDLQAAEREIATLRKEAASQRRRREDLLERVPLACVLTDASGTIVEINRRGVLELNASRGLTIGRSIELYFGDRAAAADLVSRLPDISGPVHAEATLKPRERRARPCRIVVQPASAASPPAWRWFLLC